MRETILREMDEQGITIDAKRLTDVNLLKRQVLKRCLYGVDLNPMAVELAKVSLWLDCFTLGAPLSFLDHHLRCGNSLIGSTVDEVNQATQMGQLNLLSGNRFAGMKQAVAGMIHIGELSDVTAAQVHESRQEYKRAIDALKPAKRLLDIYSSQWFGNAPKMLGHGKKKQEYNRAFEFLCDVASDH
jgi:Eco57I restriction-modification methylase